MVAGLIPTLVNKSRMFCLPPSRFIFTSLALSADSDSFSDSSVSLVASSSDSDSCIFSGAFSV